MGRDGKVTVLANDMTDQTGDLFHRSRGRLIDGQGLGIIKVTVREKRWVDSNIFLGNFCD